MQKEWWENAVFYYIYVRSFQDSDGNGVGDLAGIISRLDYISQLGVDGIRLSPIFESPDQDFGYDISDYYAVHHDLGDANTFDLLIEQAHNRGLKVILDMVVTHTSDSHPWFVDSSTDAESAYSKYYLWEDTVPNNWMSAFGGKGWSFHQKRNQYYFHSFFAFQPDLNWQNSQVAEEFKAVLRHWYDLGVDGIHLAYVNGLTKDASLRNNPVSLGTKPYAYSMQRHIFDRNRPETYPRLLDLRHIADSYETDRLLCGDILYEMPGEPELAAAYIGRDSDMLHLSFDASLLHVRFSAAHWRRVAKRWYEAIGSKRTPAWTLNNHDLSRFSSRVRGNEDKMRLAALFLLTQRGTIFLYYGEELGLQNSRVALKKKQDPLGKRFWPFHRGRDLARGPMVWSTGKGSGFTTGKSWLEVTPSANYFSVENQELEQDSMLNFYRAMIALRDADPVLQRGICDFLTCNNPAILAYTRILGDEQRLIILNMSGRSQPCTLLSFLLKDGVKVRARFSTHSIERETGSGESVYLLAPYQGIIFAVISQSLKSKSS